MAELDWKTFYFQWPWMLLLLWSLPIATVWYMRAQKHHWQEALRFSQVALLEHLSLKPSPFRRLIMPITSLLMMSCLILAMARPTMVLEVPTRSVDLMIVLDVSLSMMAKDIQPSRLESAVKSAAHFVESLPPEVRVGLTLFAGNVYVVTPPTREHRLVLASLNRLKIEDLQPRTEIGTAIQAAIKSFQGLSPSLNQEKSAKPSQKVILLLSDGDSREGYPWEKAAENAKNQDIFIDTVGVGSAEPTFILYQNHILPVTFSESTLRKIASIADGQYFRVFQDADFKTVYEKVRHQTLTIEKRTEEIGIYFTILAFIALCLGSILSVTNKKFP